MPAAFFGGVPAVFQNEGLYYLGFLLTDWMTKKPRTRSNLEPLLAACEHVHAKVHRLL